MLFYFNYLLKMVSLHIMFYNLSFFFLNNYILKKNA